MWAAVAQLLACPTLLREGQVLDRLLQGEVLHGLWAFLAPTITEVAAVRGEACVEVVGLCDTIGLSCLSFLLSLAMPVCSVSSAACVFTVCSL